MIENLVPYNYFLTKSMEWATKSYKFPNNDMQNSGKIIKLEEYWAAKKFLTYYSLIFSNEQDLTLESTYDAISLNFNNFIDSLEEEHQAAAREYFFLVDISSNNFFTWSEFMAGVKQFSDPKEKLDYYLKAKKVYFMYLLGTGGQKGEKKYILHNLLAKQRIPFILLVEKVTEKYPHLTYQKINSIINDSTSQLRNVRQLMNYYGFFYGRRIENEHYSLTSIGELAAKATAPELLIIFEHQKINMLSQPPTVKLVPSTRKDKDRMQQVNLSYFKIEIDPYLKLLEYINKYGSISIDEYRYIVSRNLPNEKDLLAVSKKQLDSIETSKSDDFIKELKKYLHGVSSSNSKTFSMLRDTTNTKNYAEISNKEVLYSYIQLIHEYKKQKQEMIGPFIPSYESIVTRSYNGSTYTLPTYDEIPEWYDHISNPNEKLLTYLIAFDCFSLIKFNNEKITPKIIRKKYGNLVKFLNLDNIVFNQMLTLINGSNEIIEVIQELSMFGFTKKDLILSTEGNTLVNFLDFKELKKKSYDYFDDLSNKQRKQIAYIKSYYKSKNVSHCDCCGEKSFKTKNDEYYLEYHHLVPISKNGPDHILNIFGICATCHRKFHFQNENKRDKLYQDLDSRNFVSLPLYLRYKELYEKGIIKELELDYLIREKALDNAQAKKIRLYVGG